MVLAGSLVLPEIPSVVGLKKKIIPPLETTLLPKEPEDILELDEAWTFVGTKQNPHWIWVALCRRTRQIVGFWIGGRTEKDCQHLYDCIAAPYKDCKSVSDGLTAYAQVFDYAKHKTFVKKAGETNHVERFFGTMRARMSRCIRKSLSFSKSTLMLILSFTAFVYDYNLTLKNKYQIF